MYWVPAAHRFQTISSGWRVRDPYGQVVGVVPRRPSQRPIASRRRWTLRVGRPAPVPADRRRARRARRRGRGGRRCNRTCLVQRRSTGGPHRSGSRGALRGTTMPGRRPLTLSAVVVSFGRQSSSVSAASGGGRRTGLVTQDQVSIGSGGRDAVDGEFDNAGGYLAVEQHEGAGHPQSEVKAVIGGRFRPTNRIGGSYPAGLPGHGLTPTGRSPPPPATKGTPRRAGRSPR